MDFTRRNFIHSSTAAASLALMPKNTLGKNINNDVLRVGMNVVAVSDPAQIVYDPARNQIGHMCENLVVRDFNGRLQPNLLEYWQFNDNATKLKLKVKEGIKWSNGDNLNADDIAFNIERWVDPATGSATGRLFKSIAKFDSKNQLAGIREKAIEKLDDYTLQLNLSKPDVGIISYFFYYTTAIVHRNFEKWGSNIIENPVGTGSFILDDFNPGSYWSMKQNKNFRNKKPNFSKLQYIDFDREQSSFISALYSNQIDIISTLSAQAIPVLEGMNVNINDVNSGKAPTFTMRTDVFPFSDIRLRKAIQLAVDREKILETGQLGYGSISYEDHMISSLWPEYTDIEKKNKRDITYAKKLIKEAGLENETIELTYAKSRDWNDSGAAILKNDLNSIGLNLKLSPIPEETFFDVWDKVPFSIISWGHKSPLKKANAQFHSKGPTNTTRLNNSELDSLIEKANASVDIEKRREIFKEIELIVHDSACYAMPFWPKLISVTSPNVKNFKVHPANVHFFNNVYKEK